VDVADLGDPVTFERGVETGQNERDGNDLHVLRLDLPYVDEAAQQERAERRAEQDTPVYSAFVHASTRSFTATGG
jgi:hypothetical protein